MTTSDPTITELLASTQREMAEAIRIQREAVARIATLQTLVARLIVENTRLRVERHALGAMGFVGRGQ